MAREFRIFAIHMEGPFKIEGVLRCTITTRNGKYIPKKKGVIHNEK